MPQLQIQLPCKASELTEAIRGFCEQHGCYDTAVVKVLCIRNPMSWDNEHKLEISKPEEEGTK